MSKKGNWIVKMEATKKYREKYAPRDTKYYSQYVPAGSKDVLMLCRAVERLTFLVEDAILYLGDNSDLLFRSEQLRNRLNMILMDLGT